jgi:hypothetical protein
LKECISGVVIGKLETALVKLNFNPVTSCAFNIFAAQLSSLIYHRVK